MQEDTVLTQYNQGFQLSSLRMEFNGNGVTPMQAHFPNDRVNLFHHTLSDLEEEKLCVNTRIIQK